MNTKAMQKIGYGMYIIGARNGEKLNGQVANTLFQITSDPPTVAVSINKTNLTHEYIKASRALSASILCQSTPLSYIGSFGFKSGRNVDKLSQTVFEEGVTGCPVVTENTIAVVEAEIINRLDAGTHTIFLGEIVRAETLKEGKPLTYAYYREHLKGKTPENAPGYSAGMAEERKEKQREGRLNMKKYVCSICGYVYDPEQGDPENGVAAGTPFEDLPNDWVCPVCGADKDQFEPE